MKGKYSRSGPGGEKEVNKCGWGVGKWYARSNVSSGRWAPDIYLIIIVPHDAIEYYG
jgi:hypothetical protein